MLSYGCAILKQKQKQLRSLIRHEKRKTTTTKYQFLLISEIERVSSHQSHPPSLPQLM